ncbi:MAG: FecR domain-containing protein [Cytophagales bacterium]|nr:FecR domain-containing protein [Cytophagales bacterium]
MKYEDFNEWDFVEDEYFVKWVLQPNKYSNKFWENFMTGHPDKREQILLARQIVTNIRYKHDPQLTGTEYTSRFEKLLADKRKLAFSHHEKSWWQSNRQWLKVAAMLFMALTITYLVVNPFSDKKNDQIVAEVMVTKHCPPGAKLTFILDDGTKAVLNSGSTITFPEKFDDTVRRVQLRGEAFFEVKKDATRPFKVISGLIETQVLGTAFNVKAYGDDDRISVAVLEGKVRVRSTTDSPVAFEHTLVKSQESLLNISNKQALQRELEDGYVFGWKEWKLVYREKRLDLILKELERWYDVRFQIDQGIDVSQTHSGSFHNEPLTVVLRALKFQNAFDYRIDGKNVQLIPKNDMK